jgi:hypothetical protein
MHYLTFEQQVKNKMIIPVGDDPIRFFEWSRGLPYSSTIKCPLCDAGIPARKTGREE